MGCLDPKTRTGGGESIILDQHPIVQDQRTTEEDTSRMLGFFFANPGGSVISNGIPGMVWGPNQRLSIAVEGLMPDILSTLGHADAMVPIIWLPSPTLQVTSSTFGHDRRR